MLSESLDKRLGWIKPDYYEKIDKDDSFVIKESVEIDDKKVSAEIHFRVQNAALKFIPEKKGISFLNSLKVGEAIIFVINGNEVDIHIIECKTTVGLKTWGDIRNKFKGSLIYSLPFIGILNLSVHSVKFYTVYLNDKMQPNPNENALSSIFKVDHIKQWKDNKITISSVKSAPHHKIKLIRSDDDKIEEVRITL